MQEKKNQLIKMHATYTKPLRLSRVSCRVNWDLREKKKDEWEGDVNYCYGSES